MSALESNTTGGGNTADGVSAGLTTNLANVNTTGSNNTFLGFYSGPGTSTQLNNATAIGANAVVSASNALVLGSINGVNGATAGVNVGVGVAVPLDKLQVVGDIRVGTSGTNGCLKNFAGTAISGTCSSDFGLKKNIQPFSLVLNKLVQLQPMTYNWRAEEFPQYHFGPSRASGLIAQEVEKVFPDMVATDENGYKAVNYTELPLLLLQAVRELKAENDSLHEENQSLHAENATIREQLRAIDQLRAQLKAESEQHQTQETEWEERMQRVETSLLGQTKKAMLQQGEGSISTH